MQTFTFKQEVLDAIYNHAIKEYPSESCGWVIQYKDNNQKYIASKNLQDQYHKLDPEAYPRTSKEAFLMNVLELNRSIEESQNNQGVLYSIVHSHIEVGAYFSEEDKKQMSDVDTHKPIYNSNNYLVVNVNNHKKVDQLAIFYFSEVNHDFIQGEVNIIQ